MYFYLFFGYWKKNQKFFKVETHHGLRQRKAYACFDGSTLQQQPLDVPENHRKRDLRGGGQRNCSYVRRRRKTFPREPRRCLNYFVWLRYSRCRRCFGLGRWYHRSCSDHLNSGSPFGEGWASGIHTTYVSSRCPWRSYPSSPHSVIAFLRRTDFFLSRLGAADVSKGLCGRISKFPKTPHGTLDSAK